MFRKKPQSPNSTILNPNQEETNGTGSSSSKITKRNSPTSRGKAKLPVIKKDPMPGSPSARDWDTEARIAARAYEIYEERIRLGVSLQDWLRAEQEVLAIMHQS